ncbi:MAG: acyltransferase family protein [Gordonibacter sp.]|nr:acyltransferase family protein [Gordonibacter sp.]
MTNSRLGWVDIAKGLAIISVILGHSYEFGNPIHALVYSFHIPLFFILAGYTTKLKSQKQILVPSVKRLLLPYAALCLFNLLLNVINPAVSFSDLGYVLLGYVFAGSDPAQPFGFPGVGLAWFLMALFTSRVLFNVITTFFVRFKVPELVRAATFLLLACGAYILSSYISLPLAGNQAFVAMLFLYLGFILKKYQFITWVGKWWVASLSLLAWMVLSTFGVFFSIGNMFYLGSFACGLMMTIAASVVVLFICIKIDNLRMPFFSNALSYAGVNSLLFLCVHQIEAAFINWPSIVFPSVGEFSIIVVGTIHILMVIVIIWMISLNPIQGKAFKKIQE